MLLRWTGDYDFTSEESRDIRRMPGYNDWMRRAQEAGHALVWRIRYDGFSDCALVEELADNYLTERLRPTGLRGSPSYGSYPQSIDPHDIFDFTSVQYGPIRDSIARGMFDVLRMGSWDNSSGNVGGQFLFYAQHELSGLYASGAGYINPIGTSYYPSNRRGPGQSIFCGQTIVRVVVPKQAYDESPVVTYHTRTIDLPWVLEIASVSGSCIPSAIASRHVLYGPHQAMPNDDPLEFEFDTPPLMIRWPRRVEHYYDVYQNIIPGTPDYATIADPEWRTARCRVVQECRELTLGEYKALWWPGIGINHETRQPLSDPLSDPPIDPPEGYYWTDLIYDITVT